MVDAGVAVQLGFRTGDKGTHSSRTIMLEELTALLEQVGRQASRADYLAAVVHDNALHKQTAATRKLTAQRLVELYALDPAVPLFRVLRRFWKDDTSGRPLLALLCALARDPLLRATVQPVLTLRVGEELSRQTMTDAIRTVVKGRLNDATLDKVVRNASSSWQQSGHLTGRTRKFRQSIRPTPLATAYALMLGYLQGLRAGRVFETAWARVLDTSVAELKHLAAESKRLGALDLKAAGDVIDISFGTVLTAQEIKDSHVTH